MFTPPRDRPRPIGGNHYLVLSNEEVRRSAPPGRQCYFPVLSGTGVHYCNCSPLPHVRRVAQANTRKNLETCAVLAGTLKKGVFTISTLVVPKQEATSDSCSTINEEEIFEAQDQRGLFQLGWIHTHPTQTCFMSSIDLHTHYSYQVRGASSVVRLASSSRCLLVSARCFVCCCVGLLFVLLWLFAVAKLAANCGSLIWKSLQLFCKVGEPVLLESLASFQACASCVSYVQGLLWFMPALDLLQVMSPEAIAIVCAPTDPSRKYGIFRLSDPAGVKTIGSCQRRGFHPHDNPPDGSPIYEQCGHVKIDAQLAVEVLDLR
jgi:proteasome lid subunit RPN8/RPN11